MGLYQKKQFPLLSSSEKWTNFGTGALQEMFALEEVTYCHRYDLNIWRWGISIEYKKMAKYHYIKVAKTQEKMFTMSDGL